MKFWKTYKFSDFVEINPTVKLQSGNEYSFVEMKDLSESQKFAIPSAKRNLTGGARFENDDTLFARITPCLENGKICQVKNLEDGKGFGSTEFLVFRGKKNVSTSNFVFYLSRFNEVRSFAERNMSGTSGRQRVNKEAFVNLYLELPPIEEQKAIAEILSSLDDKIELNRQMNATLEAMARSVFKAWFVDFEPVRANSENLPSTSVSPESAKLFPDEFENGIPKGWLNGTIADLGKVICGKTPSTKIADNFGIDIPFITIPDMHEKIFVTRTARYLSNRGANTQTNKYLPAKSICVSCIATAGLVALSSEISQTNQQINSVVPNDDFGTYYTFQVLDKLGQEIRTKGSGGSVFVNLNTSSFSRISVLLPKKNCAAAYNNSVNPTFEKILNNEKENQKLAEIRDSLLPRLISGKIRVGEAEDEIAQSV